MSGMPFYRIFRIACFVMAGYPALSVKVPGYLLRVPALLLTE